MAKFFLPDATHEERLEAMKQQADNIAIEDYYKTLSEEELIEIRNSIIKNLEIVDKHDEELKAAKVVHAAATKKLKIENAALRLENRTKRRSVTGEVYRFVDSENGMEDAYDENGELLHSRRLTPEERRQGRLFSIGKTANG